MTTNRRKQQKYFMLSCAIATWIALPGLMYSNSVQAEGSVYVTADRAHEEAKYNSQQVSIITKKDIEQKQAKSVEDIIFTESGVSRTVDSMGRVGVSIRGAEARHTLILVDGQAVLGDLAKFSGAADEVMRLGTENVERIEIVQGSASAKYGSDAIGGVVNIITKKA
ncbi:MAG: TonB-dependent receptor, partial [Veillonella sp.]